MIQPCLLAYGQLWRGWQWNEMVTSPCNRYSVPNLRLISQDFEYWSCSLWKFQKAGSTLFHSHINLAWLCNLRFDYSKTFGGFAWTHVVLTASPMPSREALIHSSLIPKSCLWEHKSIKFLLFLYCPPQLSEK